ncbi:MAG: YtxH domain-containing protein [Deltaproteobacteria bacterium]|nr:YtxH domain-containing protein [Deltaproteobacteria bacterium]
MAFLLGGIAGAALALLYAPSSGAETRKKLRDGLEDAGEWAKDRCTDTRDRIGDSADKVRQMVSDRKEDLTAAYESGKEAFHRGKERLTKETS